MWAGMRFEGPRGQEKGRCGGPSVPGSAAARL